MAKTNVFAAAEYLVIRRANRTVQKTVLYLMLYYAQKEYKKEYGTIPYDANFYKSQYGTFLICDEMESKFKKQHLVEAKELRRYREDIDDKIEAVLDRALERFATVTSFDIKKLMQEL